MPFLFRAHAASHIGGRANNEDAYLINEELGLFIVADGMGGHEKGEVASWFTSTSLEAIIGALKHNRREDTLDETAPAIAAADNDDRLLEYAVMRINRRLHEQNEAAVTRFAGAADHADDGIGALLARRKRMGTTLVSLLIRGRYAWVTHIGDSRAYRIAADSIERLTRDHTWVEEKMRSGELTPEEARTHQKRNVIMRSVGFHEDVEADIERFTVHPPERFLLCTDGLSNIVPEKDLLELGRLPDVRSACDRMVALAVDRGGRDNVTAVLVEVSKGAKPESASSKEFTD